MRLPSLPGLRNQRCPRCGCVMFSTHRKPQWHDETFCERAREQTERQFAAQEQRERRRWDVDVMRAGF